MSACMWQRALSASLRKAGANHLPCGGNAKSERPTWHLLLPRSRFFRLLELIAASELFPTFSANRDTVGRGERACGDV